jgi:NhaA family Na+:H+ antiporter
VFGLAIVAGIGFTVALFVTSISLEDPALVDAAKVGILFGSLVAGVVGYLFLRATPDGAQLTETDDAGNRPETVLREPVADLVP